MTRLFIMRHAKSDWSVATSDFERPLNRRGIKSSEKMALWLASQDTVPELVVTSPAVRALETTRIVCRKLGINDQEIVQDERIYDADLDDLLTVISEYGRNKKHMLLSGHNPGLDQLVEYLSGDQPGRNRKGKLMTTAAIAIMDFSGQKISAEPGMGMLVQVARPSEI